MTDYTCESGGHIGEFLRSGRSRMADELVGHEAEDATRQDTHPGRTLLW